MTAHRSDGETGEPLLLWELVQTAHLAERAFTDAFVSSGLSPGHFGVLSCLADEPGITQARIARNLGVRPQTIARTISTLLGASLVERLGAGGRGHATPLALTSRGRAHLDRAWPAALTLNDPASLGLTSQDAAALGRALTIVRKHLSSTEAERNAATPPASRTL